MLVNMCVEGADDLLKRAIKPQPFGAAAEGESVNEGLRR